MQFECKIGYAWSKSWWSGGVGYNMTNAKWFAGSVVGGCPLWTICFDLSKHCY